MDILVDYNNLPRLSLNRGPTQIVEKLLSTLGSLLADEKRLNVRLYDGWYQDQSLTPRAQIVSAEIAANFPSTHSVSEGATIKRLLVSVEMAYCLKIDPVAPLWHTYRMKGSPRNLSCANPISVGCTAIPCELVNTQRFFQDRKCPSEACTITPANLINRGEQKLVDGMVAADLYYLHVLKETKVAIVSSDDDVWPAIRTVLDLGMHVIHVHPLVGHRTPSYYSRGPRPMYTELDL